MYYLFKLVKHIYSESQHPHHPVSAFLQRPRHLTGSLDLNKSHATTRQKHDAVGHTVEPGADEFRRDISRFFYGIYEFCSMIFSFMIHPQFYP